MQIEEIKRHLDGRVERHSLRLVLRRPHLVVALYEFAQGLQADGFTFARGSFTYGFFWKRRPYVMYRMLDRQGQLVANRFDVFEDVRLGERDVSYRDLLLDLWIDAAGVVQIADEDEVDQARRDGKLSVAQLQRIEHTRELLLRRHRATTRGAEQLLP